MVLFFGDRLLKAVAAKGLPQGDGWSPIALSLVLSVVQRCQINQVPCAKTMLYLDDRTILARNINHTNSALNVWQRLETVTRMRANVSKTQPLARSWDAYVQFEQQGWTPQAVGTILGVSLGIFPRGPSQKEQDRERGLLRVARRIGLLPVSSRFRAVLASLVLTSKASWGAIFNGRVPSNTALTKAFGLAIHYPYVKLHSSPDLRRFFVWGHRSDLQLVACQNLLVAFTRWRPARPHLAHVPNTPLMLALRRSLSKLQCNLSDLGHVSWAHGSWDTTSPAAWTSRLAHNLREFWRRNLLAAWLRSSRNDSAIARGVNLVITPSLVDQLHQSSLLVSGHESAVLSGGLRTPAHSQIIPQSCVLCGQPICPDTDHIFWTCSFFAHLRLLPRPRDPLVARVGWGQQGISGPILKQMSLIQKHMVTHFTRNPDPAMAGDGGRRGGGAGGAPLV